MNKILFTLNLKEDKKEIFKVLKNYANAIACRTSFDDETKIEELNEIIYFGQDEYGIDYYYVIWRGDVACYGGSGTIAYYITEVFRYSDRYYKRFYVNNIPVFEAKVLSNLKKVGDKLEVVVHSLNKDDSDCCHSLLETYILAKDEVSGKWSAIIKK